MSGSSSRRHAMALKCHRRTGRERWGTTRLWARAHVRRLLLPVWACGRPAPVWRLAERALPSRIDPRPVRSIPRGGRRSDLCPSARSTMARTVRTPIPCRGASRGGGRRIRRRHRARRRCGTKCCPTRLTIIDYPERRGPGCPCAPHRRRGPWPNPSRCEGRRDSPRANGGECCRCRGGRPRQRSGRVGGLRS
jgi:hypothetical protein